MMRLIDKAIRIAVTAVILTACSNIPATASTYNYVPLKENASSLGQLGKSNTGSFQPYKVVVIKDKLKVLKQASSASIAVGSYKLGSIVEVKNTSGKYLKTSQGYIYAADTKKLSGMVMKAANDAKLILPVTLKEDTRTARKGKTYKIVGSKGGYLMVKIGRINGYLPMSTIKSISDKDTTKITLAWEMIGKKSGNATVLSKSESHVNIKSNALGLDVLSPTWFDMTGTATSPSSIDILDIADKQYSNVAHSNGYEVWARFCEMDKKRAAVVFNNSVLRAKLIDKLVSLALLYDVDGINVDYEALGIDNRDGFSNFMKELFPKLKKYNMNVSVDVTRISKTSTLYSLCYDRPTLAKYSDYLMLMAYDEHYSSSEKAGSVGSYDWVETSIKDVLKEGVSPDQLILGAPFYLRDFSVPTFDAVITKVKTKVYGTSSTVVATKLGTAKKGTSYKYLNTVKDWYMIEYNGKNAYITSKDSKFYKANTVVTSPSGIDITTGQVITYGPGGAIDLVIPYDMAVLDRDSAVYSAPYEGTTKVLGEVDAKSVFKYTGKEKECYIVSYNGGKGYLRIADTTLGKANGKAVASVALSMQAGIDRIFDYDGTIEYDSLARQDVGTYTKDGVKHSIWLETDDSMQWRMEFVNKYKLPGAAFWSLNWKTTEGIWETIRKTLKK